MDGLSTSARCTMNSRVACLPPVPRAERHRGWAFPRDKEGVKIREGVGCCDGELVHRSGCTSTRAHLSSEPLFAFLLFSFIFFPFSSSLFPSSLCLPLSRIGPLTARLGVDGAWAWRSCKNGDTFPRIVVKVEDVWVSSVKCKFKKKLLKYRALILLF